jgi:hypothetical protein
MDLDSSSKKKDKKDKKDKSHKKDKKKDSNGFSHFIHSLESTAKKDIKITADEMKHLGSKAVDTIKQVPHVLKEGAVKAEHAVETGAVAVGHGIQKTINGISDTIDYFEQKALPSPKAIIGETALLVGGLAVVGVLVIKFL